MISNIFKNIKEKKVVSVEFVEDSYFLVDDFAKKAGNSFGWTVNFLIESLLELDPKTKYELSRFCATVVKEIDISDHFYSHHMRSDAELERKNYMELIHFFNGAPVFERNKGKKKRKASVEMSARNYDLLQRACSNENTTTGRYINYLISNSLGLMLCVKEKITSYCGDKVKEISIKMAYAQEFERAQLELMRDSCKKVCFLLTQSNYIEAESLAFDQHIKLKDGYLICPKDWKILNGILDDCSKSEFAGVVEVRNPGTYDVPHVVFFTNKRYAKNYTPEECETVLKECKKRWPDYSLVEEMQIPPTELEPSDPKYFDEVRKHVESPYIGLFHILATDDPYFFHNDYLPYGAVIVKDKDAMDSISK